MHNHPDYSELIPYEITEEPNLVGLTEEAADFLTAAHSHLNAPNRALIRDLEDFANRYPNIPIFKSHLLVVYANKGKLMQARKMGRLIRKKHPDYLFGRINLAGLSIKKSNAQLIRDLLGEDLWLHKLLPEKQVFHHSEVVGYYNVVAQQLLVEGNIEAAKERHKVMILAFPDRVETRNVALEVITSSLKAAEVERKLERKKEILAPSFSKVADQYPAILTAPNFECELIDAFYHYDDDYLPTEMLADLPKVDLAVLARDCERVITDAIQRYDYFVYGSGTEESYFFLHHALQVATALHLTSLIPTLLDFFRSGEECILFWMENEAIDYSEHLLREGVPTYWKQYQELVQEDNVYSVGKVSVIKAVIEAALQNENLREDAVQWSIEIFRHFKAQPNNNNLIDSVVISFLVAYAIALRDERLIEPVEFVYKQSWVLLSIAGTLEENLTLLAKPFKPRKASPIPTLEFYYKQDYSLDLDEDEEEDEDDIFTKYYANIVMAGLLGMEDTLFPDVQSNDFPLPEESTPSLAGRKPSLQRNPNVGRNEPCPCGSGKKYKKCCWNT